MFDNFNPKCSLQIDQEDILSIVLLYTSLSKNRLFFKANKIRIPYLKELSFRWNSIPGKQYGDKMILSFLWTHLLILFASWIIITIKLISYRKVMTFSGPCETKFEANDKQTWRKSSYWLTDIWINEGEPSNISSPFLLYFSMLHAISSLRLLFLVAHACGLCLSLFNFFVTLSLPLKNIYKVETKRL